MLRTELTDNEIDQILIEISPNNAGNFAYTKKFEYKTPLLMNEELEKANTKNFFYLEKKPQLLKINGPLNKEQACNSLTTTDLCALGKHNIVPI